MKFTVGILPLSHPEPYRNPTSTEPNCVFYPPDYGFLYAFFESALAGI